MRNRGGARRIRLERRLRSDDGAYRAGGDFRLRLDQSLRRRQSREVVAARARRPVAAAQIEMQLGDAACFADRDPHAVAPKSVGQIVRDGVDAGMAHEAPVDGRRRRHDFHLVAHKIDSRIGQKVPQSQHRKLHRRRNPQALERAEIAALDVEVGAHAEEPIGMLRQRAEQLGALPAWKSPRRGVGRTAEEMQRTVTQPFRPVAGAVAVLKHDVDALLLEEAKLDRRDRDEIRR